MRIALVVRRLCPDPPRRAGLFATGLALFALAAPEPTSGQDSDVARRAEALRDSIAAVESAREAQGRYERMRIRLSPRARGPSGGGSCDERVGRVCFWHEGGSDWWWPERESEELVAARDSLIVALARAAVRVPGDVWILGQRIAYLGEAGRWAEAETVARRCVPGSDWRCPAFVGLSLHARGRTLDAVDAYDRALAAMPPDEAAQWLDIEDLLTGDGRKAWERARDRGDSTALARFWAAADPLFLVEGNDRYVEHLARHTWALTREAARNGYGMSWGRDLEEFLIRYGHEVGWERRDPGAGSATVTSTAVGHQHPLSKDFTPPPEVLDGDTDTEPRDWNPGSRREPRSSYAPPDALTVLPIEARIALLPRGDSTVLVVAVPTVPDDTTHHAEHAHPPVPDHRAEPDLAPRRGLFAMSLSGPPRLTGQVSPGLAGAFALSLEPDDYVVSVETLDPVERRAGRLRQGVPIAAHPRDVATLSDLLLARPGGALPTELEDLLDDVVPTAIHAPGDTIRVAWELHGLGWIEEQLGYTLTLQEVRGGLFSRLGRVVGIGGDERTVGLEWTEAGPSRTGPHLRAADLVVPADWEEGRYRLRLEVRSQGRGTLVSEMPLSVSPGRARR